MVPRSESAYASGGSGSARLSVGGHSGATWKSLKTSASAIAVIAYKVGHLLRRPVLRVVIHEWVADETSNSGCSTPAGGSSDVPEWSSP
jgi:hypothetical protein